MENSINRAQYGQRKFFFSLGAKKKNLGYLAALILMVFGLAGCEKQSLGLTNTTYYAVIQLEGETTMVVPKGSSYVEPGFTATMAGEDVSNQVAVSGTVDETTSGVYAITYSIKNKDGFTSSVTRTVVVLDVTDPIEGFWAADASCYRDYGGTKTAFGAPFEILIIAEGEGKYYVDDILEGWYSQRAGYGATYAMQANITVASDGTITLDDSYIPGWGDGLDYLSGGSFNAATKQISYQVGYAGIMDFYITLNKVDL